MDIVHFVLFVNIAIIIIHFFVRKSDDFIFPGVILYVIGILTGMYFLNFIRDIFRNKEIYES